MSLVVYGKWHFGGVVVEGSMADVVNGVIDTSSRKECRIDWRR